MSCKKELDVGYPQVTIIVIEWTKTFFFWRQEMDWTKNSTKFYRKIQSVLMTEAHLQNPSLTHDQYYILFGHDILVNIWRFRLENAIHDMVSPITNYEFKFRNFKIFFFFRPIRKESGRFFFWVLKNSF